MLDQDFAWEPIELDTMCNFKWLMQQNAMEQMLTEFGNIRH